MLSQLPVSSESKTTASITKESKNDSTSVVTSGKTNSTTPRYSEYYEELKDLEIFHGDMEPLYLKGIRPFLLPSEVVSVSGGKRNNNNGKSKTKAKDNIVRTWATGSMPASSMIVPISREYQFSSETYQSAFITGSTTLPVFASKYFALSDLNDYTSLTGVFDMYRVDQIEVWLIPRNVAGSTATGGPLVSVIDYDDAGAFATTGDALQHSTAHVAEYGFGVYRKFIPRMAVASYSGAFTSYTSMPPQWIDVASASVQHYGLKLAKFVDANANIYDLNVRYLISFKNSR